jgi:glutamate-1-semialdehyde aminotransferase
MCLLSNSGSEAVEAGLKLARAATRRTAFVYCKGGFHGLNLGSLSVMGTERMRAPFEPLLADCTAVPYGDLGALEKALKQRKVAAFLAELPLRPGRRWRVEPAAANGQPAVAFLIWDEAVGAFLSHGLSVLGFAADGAIAAFTTFLDPRVVR